MEDTILSNNEKEESNKETPSSSSSSSSSPSSSSSYWSRWWKNKKSSTTTTTTNPQDSPPPPSSSSAAVTNNGCSTSSSPFSSVKQQQQQQQPNNTYDNDSSSSTLSLPPSQHSIFSKAYWDDLMDDQRMERLQQCERLTYVLQACQSKHKNDNDTNKKLQQQIPQLDQLSEGLRMLKYFDWRHRIAVNQSGCVPEQHAVWACRSVALGCGRDLQQLKQCFQHEGHLTVLKEETQVGYESGSITNNEQTIPCREFQQAVGQCVSQNAQRLQTKQQERRQQQQKQQQPSEN